MHRFDTGGLENGVVNLLNRLPCEDYRHAIVALDEVTDFRRRVHRGDVEYFALHKRPGHGFWLFPRLFTLFRKLNPAIVHTRNLAALEVALPAWAAGVAVRIHGEHGRDVQDLDGSNRTYQRVRRFYRPFISHYVALSKDLERYLRAPIGISPHRISQIYNGVDTVRFLPASGRRSPIEGSPFNSADLWLVGTVGRMRAVKDQLTLAKAFIAAVRRDDGARRRLRLVIVGEGPLRAQVQALLTSADMSELAWLPGEREDVPAILRGLDCFVLPSLAEGISNTILEAMACGLPVIATRVGGNAELVDDATTGRLVAPVDPGAMADCMLHYLRAPELAIRHGTAGRDKVVKCFSVERMVDRYAALYDRLLRGMATAPVPLGEV